MKSRASWLVVVLLLLPAFRGVAGEDPPTQEASRLEADLGLANDFLTVFSGGQAGLPWMDGKDAVALARALSAGDFDGAREQAWSMLRGKAVALAGGAPAAFYTAVGLGESLGMKATEFFGRGKLRNYYETILPAVHASKAHWPSTPAAAREDDFIWGQMAPKLHVVTNWLETLPGMEGHSRWALENKAYLAIIAQRDFDVLCDRYGLEGEERNADALRRCVEEETRRAGIEARARRDVRLFCAELDRARDEEEALRRRLRAEEEQAAKERLAREAEAKAKAQEALHARIQALLPQADPLPEPAATEAPIATTAPVERRRGPLVLRITRTAQGPQETTFSVAVTNVSGGPLADLGADVQPLRVGAEGGGVAWGSAAPEATTLEPGAQLTFTCVASGDLDAVVVTLRGGNRPLATELVRVVHAAAPASNTAESGDWPRVYRGAIASRLEATCTDGQTATKAWELPIEFRLHADGTGTVVRGPGSNYGVTVLPIVGKDEEGLPVVTGWRFEVVEGPQAREEFPAPHGGGALHFEPMDETFAPGNTLRVEGEIRIEPNRLVGAIEIRQTIPPQRERRSMPGVLAPGWTSVTRDHYDLPRVR